MSKEVSRLGVFVFFDPQGIVDDYVIRLLQSFRESISRMVVVSNVALSSAEQEKLERNADAVFVRENSGLDAAAFKAGMVTFCGWEEVEKYDEVVLINDTFFGPVHSFSEMFDEMQGRDIDFWGMSAGYSCEDGWHRVKYGYIPTHIQTFFVAFRKKMVCSKEFQNYWNSYDDTMNDFVSVVTQHETTMTKHFQDLGFRWDIYADTQRYKSKHRSENFNIYHHHAHNMMRYMKFPVLKKKVLGVSMTDYLYMNDLEEPADAMRYIHNESEYDAHLIWDNVLRLYNLTDLYNSLHLNCIFSSAPIEEHNIQRAALIYHVANPFFAELFCRHACQLSETLDVYLIPGSTEIKALFIQYLPEDSKVKVLEATDQKTEMGHFVLLCTELAEQYSYLGFVHDVDNSAHYPTTVPESTVYGYLQNVANDGNYVKQIVNCFENNPRLGVLGTPFPIHHNGFNNYGNEWGEWFKDTCNLAQIMNLHCNLAENKKPFIITGAFWCRTAALRPLWEMKWTQEQFHRNPASKISRMNEVLKRILPYVAQHEGYYSGVVMHVNYASMRITGQQYMMDQVVNVSRQHLGCPGESFAGFVEQLGGVALEDLRLTKIIRIYLERKTPRWFSQSAHRFYKFCKRVLHR